MKQKKYLFLILPVLLCVLAIVMGGMELNLIFEDRVSEERINQLEQLTFQISDTFENALRFNRTQVGIAAELFLEQEYASEEEIRQGVERISNTVIGQDEDKEGNAILMLLDKDGICYDKDGSQGIWGDFDQVVNMQKYSTFISDSVNYSGSHWAFVRKLDEPVTTGDKNVTICYVVLLETVDNMSQYYASEAYKGVSEVYLLNSNGTRMYDSVTPEDTISSYNIYKYLRETEEGSDGSFDEILETLNKNEVACGNFTVGKTQYCYSLALQKEYDLVIMFLVPSSQVATSTLSMMTYITKMALIFCGLLVLLIVFMIFFMTRLVSVRRIAAIREENLIKVQNANERLAQTNESLEKANRAAQSALDIARSANRAKSSFLSNMSHDIRTPLNAIIGFLQLLEKDADDEEKVRTYTGKIRTSSQHLLNLINDILDMSKIESGKTTLNQRTFSIGEFIEKIRTVIALQAKEKNQEFIVDLSDTADLTVEADDLRLSQILMNLLSNAVKYTQKGGKVQLTVSQIGSASEKMTVLRFVVKDNGIGMSKDFQQRVFEPFERELNSTNSGVQGTGLGMAITKNLVDLMGGIILVDSIPGEGSTFTLELSFPLVNTENMTEQTGENTGNAAQGEAVPVDQNILKGKHFLVAEDNEINAEIIQEFFEMEGASCEIAVNGQEALEKFTASRPGAYDAIFMDIQMPVMGGYESTRRIRASGHPDAQKIPIAAMTANAFAEDVQQALQAGMNAHIPKPVDMGKIREFISNEINELK